MSDPSDRQLRSQVADNDSIQSDSSPGTPAERPVRSNPPTIPVPSPQPSMTERQVQEIIRNYLDLTANATGPSVTPARDPPRSQASEAPQAQEASRPTIIPESEYRHTAQHVIEIVKSNQISANSQDTKKRLVAISNAFKATELLTILDGSRRQPTCTSTNPNGYVPRSVLLNSTTMAYDIIRYDDIFHFKHDQMRLFTLVRLAFNTNMDYLCTEAFDAHDGFTVFSTISRHLQGTLATDIEKARKALHENFTFNPDVLFHVEAVRLQSLISDLNHAQGRPMEEPELRSFLIKHMFHDKREFLRTTLLICLKFQDPYQSIIDSLIAASSLVPVADAITKFAAAVTKPVQYCRNFALGKCKLGDKCRYVHLIDPNSKPQVRGLETVKKATPKAPFNYRLSPQDATIIGPPRGKPSSTNVDGYSHSQRNKIMALVSKQGIENDDTDPVVRNWGSKSESSNNPSDEASHKKLRFNSLRTSTPSPPPEGSPESPYIYEPDSPDPFTPTHILPVPSSPTPMTIIAHVAQPNDDTAPHQPRTSLRSPPPAFTDSRRLDTRLWAYITREVTTYRARTGVDESYSELYIDARKLVFWFHDMRYPKWDSRNNKVPFLQVFGWTRNIPSAFHIYPHIREDLRFGTPAFMRLIYILGAAFMNANINLPKGGHHTSSPGSIYNLYIPVTGTFRHPGEVGSYESTYTSVEQYFTTLQLIGHILVAHIDNSIKEYLLITVIYDFMSYVARRVTTTLKTPEFLDMPPPEALAKIRAAIQLEVSIQSGIYDSPTYHTEPMYAIILNVDPLPAPEPSDPEPLYEPFVPEDTQTDSPPRKRARDPESESPTGLLILF